MRITVTIATAPAGTSAARRDEEQPHHAHGSLADWPRAEVAAGGSPAPTHQQRDKRLTFRAKQHSVAAGARGHEGFLLALFVPEHQDLHQQPREDLLQASAMKILFLLFPFFLLFLQGTAGNDIRCTIEGGRCRFGGCQFAEKQIGKCYRIVPCCSSPAGTSAARRDEEQPNHAHGSLADWPRAEVAAGGSPAPSHQQRDKSLTFRAKQHSVATGARGHEGFLLALFVPEHQDLHQQPREDLLQASAMKILFLLFPFFLLFLQGAAGNSVLCRIRGGRCHVGSCHFPERHIGRCSGFQACCIRIFG
ncbi:uncharacterized protein [Anas acuta]|uniref:uncharacterized protein isoform X2 n=1 Tax=Anas acuta TaxID=28680 RepID=UPI0035C90C70